MLRGSIIKLAPLLVRSWRLFCVCNGKQDSMPTKMDRDQSTDVWEHRQESSWCRDSEVKVRKQNCQGQMEFALLEKARVC